MTMMANCDVVVVDDDDDHDDHDDDDDVKRGLQIKIQN